MGVALFSVDGLVDRLMQHPMIGQGVKALTQILVVMAHVQAHLCADPATCQAHQRAEAYVHAKVAEAKKEAGRA